MTALQTRALIEFACAAIALWLGFRFLKRRLRRAMMRYLSGRVSRMQHNAFVRRLRDLVFQDPFRFMNMLCSKEGEWFVRKLWQEVGGTCTQANIRLPPQETSGSAPGHMPDPHPVCLPDDGMGVQKCGLRDGNALAIVTLPEPKSVGETYMIGVVLPPDESLKEDLIRARKLVRYFIVNRWDMGGRNTDFCEWTLKGDEPRELTYNVGAPRDPRGFALAIEAKLEESRHRRSSRAAVVAH
jgi:hypothetical protein